jgi:hypothetical protein
MFGQFLEFFHLRLKILAEIVGNAENFGNFVGCKYAHIFISICLKFSCKGTKNIAYLQLFFTFSYPKLRYINSACVKHQHQDNFYNCRTSLQSRFVVYMIHKQFVQTVWAGRFFPASLLVYFTFRFILIS